MLPQASLKYEFKSDGKGHEIYSKMLLDHEIINPVVPWAMKVFLKNLQNCQFPTSYILSVRSLDVFKAKTYF